MWCCVQICACACASPHQLGDVGHLGHVVQSALVGLLQHDEAGRCRTQVPKRLHLWSDVTVAICRYIDDMERPDLQTHNCNYTNRYGK